MNDVLELIEILKKKDKRKIKQKKNAQLRFLLELIVRDPNLLKKVLKNINE